MSEIAVPDLPKAPGMLNDRRLQIRLGILTWLVPFLVIGILVALNPEQRTVTSIYHQASASWWAGKNLYTGEWGYHYLPQFALIFSPFHSLPAPAGDILWRLIGTIVIVTGLWRFQRRQFGPDAVRAFLYATLITMPLCLASMRNGQANLIFAALTLHAAACLSRRQWWPAAALIVLALGAKPLGIVLLLLSAAVYAPLRLRLIPLLAALALLPFLTAPPDYVLAQYRQFLIEMQMCASIAEHRFADIGGIVRTFGWELPTGISNLVRVAAGGLTLALWLKGARRLSEPFREMWLLALTTCYLMLFNPNNEPCSYVILAPTLGIWATAALSAAPTRRFGWLTASISLSMGLLPNLLYPVFGNYFALFWHPVMTIVFIATLVYWLLRPASPFAGAPAMQ